MKIKFLAGIVAGFILSVTTVSFALAQSVSVGSHNHDHHNHHMHTGHNHGPAEPISLMGTHMHKKGEWMLSYRYMHMDMEGNRDGTDDLDAATIATTVRNRFFGIPGQPRTLRVVPTDMTMDMHMLGAMYAPTDWLTLMAMGNYVKKDMDHITFAGGAGTNILGTFKVNTSGIGDTKVGGLIRLHDDHMHHVHLNAGLSLPTGSIDEEARILAPTGATPTLRTPYAMQLGTGTYDLLPGVTYTGHKDQLGWGAQYMAEIRLEDENDEGYAHGDKHSVNLWGAYQWTPWMSTSARLSGTTQSKIDGIDPEIVVPNQTADPDNYGGQVVEAGLGVNFTGVSGALAGKSFAIEGTAPLYRNLNGPQLETDWTVTAGFRMTF